MQQNASPLSQAYRLLVVILSFAASVSFGIAMHIYPGDGYTFACVGIVLGIIAQGMAVPLRNPPFNCLLVVIAVAVIAIVAIV